MTDIKHAARQASACILEFIDGEGGGTTVSAACKELRFSAVPGAVGEYQFYVTVNLESGSARMQAAHVRE